MKVDDKAEWLEARQRLLQRVKEMVESHSGENSPGLRPFKNRYEHVFKGRWQRSTPAQMLKIIRRERLILGGDFHAHPQSQRAHLRILRELSQSRAIVLGLECVSQKYQKFVDEFLSGSIEEREFLKKTRWKDSWGFPWSHYRPLFELAKRQKIKIIALNKNAGGKKHNNTEAREKYAAHLIKTSLESSESLHYVIFGDFHLSSNQLPKKLKPYRSVIIHQDSDRLYFKLAKKGIEHQTFVLKKGNQFCLMTSPPWIKWQSYYFYLEGLTDEALDGVDWTEPVRELIRVISEDMDLRMKADDFSVYLFEEIKNSKSLGKMVKKSILETAKLYLKEERSFFVPQGGLFFLSIPSVNQAASLIGDYIQSRLTGRKMPLWKMPQQFIPLLWVESLSFFCSKLINHRRKPENPMNGVWEREVLLLILEQKVDFLRFAEGVGRRSRRFRPRRKVSYFLAARLLGGLLGERMYALYRSGKIDSRTLLDWMAKDTGDEDFENFFRSVVRNLRFIPQWDSNRGI